MKNSKRPLKSIVIMFGTIIVIYLSIKLIFYCSIIGPQLFQMKESEYKVPKICSEDEIVQLLDENKGKGMMELSQIGWELFKQERYREAYNIYKLATQSDNDFKDLQDTSAIASIYVDMSDCYHKILNNRQACFYADRAIEKMPNDTYEFDLYFMYYQATIVYYDKECGEGFPESTKTINLIKKTMSLETTDVDREQYYHDSKRQLILAAIKLYGFSPNIYDKEMAINYYQKYLDFDPTNQDSYYGMTISYLDLGDTKNAKKYWDLSKENGINKTDDYVLGAYFHIVNADMKEAEKYLKKLKHTAVSHLNKTRYYYVSTLYYQALGDKEKAKEYLTKFVELSNSEVYTYQVIELEKSLDINFDYIREKLAKERDAYYSIELDVDGY